MSFIFHVKLKSLAYKLQRNDKFIQKDKQSNYQAFLWSHASRAMQDLESLEGHEWIKDREHFIPLPITKALAPVSLLKLTMCKCKTSTCQQNYFCSNTGLACTEGCFCIADNKACSDPNGLTCISDSRK